MVCGRIAAAITQANIGTQRIKAVLDPYNSAGSTAQVNFNTTKTNRWQTHPDRMPHKLGRSRQRLGRQVLPNRRIASVRKVVRQEPQPRV